MSKKKRIAAVVLVLSLAAAALLAFLGIQELQDRQAGADYYADALAQLQSALTTQAPRATPPAADDGGAGELPAPTDTAAPEEAEADPAAPTAPVATSVPMQNAADAPAAVLPTATPVPVTEVPTAALVPVTAVPTATPTPVTEVPTATPAPATAVPTATPAPATAVPTATPAPATAVPTATPAPATSVPTATAIPATESPTAILTSPPASVTAAPTATPAPATAAPTATTAPVTAAPTATPAPATVAPTATPAPVTAVPTATPAPVTAAPTATPSPATAAPTATPAPVTTVPTATPAPVTAASIATPVPTATVPPRRSALDFDTLRQTMPDICGWIVVPDTKINYPIVQGTDNDYYLSHLPDGTPNKSGSIMLDMDNDADWTDAVSVLHGHHMRANGMFGGLSKYADADYARAHAQMTLYTPGGDYQVTLIAACIVDGRKLGFPTNFEDEAAFGRFLEQILPRSAYRADYTPVMEDRLLLLSTCAYTFTNARFVVLGLMTPMP